MSKYFGLIVVTSVTMFLLPIFPTKAQLVPDNTLGAESSKVTSIDSANDRIDGGASRGANLFHSFQEFNVGARRGVSFFNPSGIKNILTRVTGSNISNILGKLGVLGEANLFLINPNGIHFGENASLDIRGSFVGTTADGIGLGDDGFFSATDVAESSLLSVQPTAIFATALANQLGEISNEGDLEVDARQNLILIGGDVNIDGGSLFAPGGSIQLGGLKGEGSIGLDGFVLSFPAGVELGNISVNNTAELNVRADGGGNITINARDIEISGATTRIRAGIDEGLGSPDAVAGNIQINATDNITIQDGAGISNQIREEGIGKAGDIEINTGFLSVTEGGFLDASTFGMGDGGNVKINAFGQVSFDYSTAQSLVYDTATGNAGNIEISTDSLEVKNGSNLEASSNGLGNAGNLKIQANGSVLLDGISSDGFISQATSRIGEQGIGNAGNIEINSTTLDIINGATLDTTSSGFGDAGKIFIQTIESLFVAGESSLNSYVIGIGNAGNIQIESKSVSLTNSDIIATNFGTGDAGNVTITASDAPVLLIGSDIEANVSERGKKGGDLIVTASSLSLNEANLESNGSEILRAGSAGNITVKTKDFVSLDNNSNISTFTAENVSNILIETANLTVQNSSIFAPVFGDRNGGNLTVNVSDSVELIGNLAERNGLVTDTLGDGNAGNINVNTNKLIIRDGAEISSRALDGKGSGGTIQINASESVELTGTTPNGLNSSKIAAETGGEGNAGNIQINTGRLLIQDGGRVSSFTTLLSSGKGGNVEVNASDRLKIIGFRSLGGFNPSSLDTSTDGTGDAGNIKIATGNLIVQQGASINSQTTNNGRAGNLEINASEFVEVSGATSLLVSKLTTTNQALFEAEGLEKAGNLVITTPKLTVSDRAQITASTSGKGDAGDIIVNEANDISLTNGGQILSQTTGEGKAGNITLNIMDNLQLVGNSSSIEASTSSSSSGDGGSIFIDPQTVVIEDGAKIAVNSQGSGTGGSINLTANNLSLDRGAITAATASQDGGNISLNVRDLLNLRNNSSISATAGQKGNGGNVAANANFILAYPKDNQIVAKAEEGNGGNINIDTNAIFGRQNLEISASSDFGLQGTVLITTPEVDPTSGLVELQGNAVDAADLVAQNPCRIENGQVAGGSTFVITGKGGLPPNPNETLTPIEGMVDWLKRPNPQPTEAKDSQSSEPQRKPVVLGEANKAEIPIQQAQGMVKKPDGRVVLTANASSVTPQNPPLQPTTCKVK
jgi:filamentous hemagglutinin family protein